jgi:conjugal transfer mating pair stabilization protein TraN
LTAYSACWAYKDSYQTPVQENGACGQYAENPACTRVAAQCDYRDGGVCLHENVTWSCESTVQGEGMLCGGQLFCQDGSCAQSAAGQDTLFAKAVSQLAAVAAAGKDVAATSDAQVMAFTGRAQSCKKQAVGFNNCCKDAGWGNDIGLAHCSSEEKALGQAKARRLTVDVGEYCSKKVLGICVEKKRSYCLFDSKLAQIVQQQGRQWQLGIGFGEPKSPDCRGISVSQLQALDFSRMDFSPFYADLNSNKAVPDNAPLLQRAQQQIQTQLNQKAAP